jgi:hypothetical protein
MAGATIIPAMSQNAISQEPAINQRVRVIVGGNDI